MGLGEPAAVAPGVPLLEQGLDSLMTLELARALEEASGVPVPATTVFRHPTVQGLADHLAARLAPRAPEEAATDVLPADVSSLGGDELRAALEKELADLTGE